jgi:hypothetical protein
MAVDEATLARHTPPPMQVLAIRDDGYLCMATQLAMMQSGGKLMRYDGDPHATLEQRLLYLRGYNVNQHGGALAEMNKVEPFNISTASRADLVEFAMDEYGRDFSAKNLPVDAIRKAVFELAQEAARTNAEAAERSRAPLPAPGLAIPQFAKGG